MKTILLALCFSLLPMLAMAADGLNTLFPQLEELPGGKNHWMMQVAEPETADNCTIYSATYAYFAKEATKLFDIPRKNIYSVNIRFHSCDSALEAEKLYNRFVAVGADERKRTLSMGERAMLYVVPNPKTEMLGDYYLNSLFKYVVLQVHADDGFVLMDIGTLMASRLSDYLRKGTSGIASGLTLKISGESLVDSIQLIGFRTNDVMQIDFSGTLYDEEERKVSGATILVLETGDTATTDGQGNFLFNLNSGEGKKIELFRKLTAERTDSFGAQAVLASGYYSADIHYEQNNKTGQDVWRLLVDRDGLVTGDTTNLADEKRLVVNGTLIDGVLTLSRLCGTSFMGVCRQNFIATDRGGYFEGSWTGSGGGGSWRLYKNKSQDATVNPKTSAPGLFNAYLESFTGVDRIGNIKVAKADGQADIVLRLEASVFGVVIDNVQVKTLGGAGSRTYNTALGNIFPGVAVVAGGELVSATDGTLHYPLEKFRENIYLHINKGALTEADVSGFEITISAGGADSIIKLEVVDEN